jgi:large subunit ribosomal protein L16
MLFKPSKTKFNKYRRGWLRRKLSKFYHPKFGRFALVSLSQGLLHARTIEACRQFINRHLKKKNKLWICVYPDIPFTKKPLAVRMGKGKGNVNGWYARVCIGKILFEVEGINSLKIIKTLKDVQIRLPFKTRLISKFLKKI